jgi:RNA polymerase sigma factor (sigma-70 family)
MSREAEASAEPPRDEEVPEEFRRLLGSTPSAIRQRYGELKLRLLKFFRWKGFDDAEDLMQEVLVRTLQKMKQEAQIRSLDAYVYGVAKHLVLELRRRPPAPVRLDDAPEPKGDDGAHLDDSILMRECLAKLSPEDRTVAAEYFTGDKRDRAALVKRLKISEVALRVRAFRLRKSLQKCIGQRS